MSHPIDDLFKKGLGEPSYAFDEQAWQGAREVLGLKKKRRRRFLWFIAGSAVVALAMLVFLLLNNDAAPTAQENKIAEDKIEMSHELSGSAESSLITDQVALNQTEGRDTYKIQNSNNEQGRAVAPGATSFKSKRDKTTFKNEKLVKNETNKIPVVIVKNDNPNLEVINNKERIDFNLEGAQTVLNSVQNSKLSQLENDAIEASSRIKNHSVDSDLMTLLGLEKISIAPFLLKEKELPVPDMTKPITKESQSVIFEKGVYVLYTPSVSGIEIGFNGVMRFNKHWSLGLGLGVSRASHASDDAFDATQTGRSNVDLNFTTTNIYNYKSIVLPMRLSYAVKKHSAFAGLILKRPFVLSGLQEASTAPNMDTMDTAQSLDVPIAPISSTFRYNLSNVPELNKLIVYGQAGYSYRLNKVLELSVGATYLLESQSRILPLINNIERSSLKQSSSSAYIRLDYRF